MNITRIIHASLVLIVCVVFLAPLETQAATTIRTATTSSILVGHWPFDDATSTRMGDFSRSGNHGTLTGFSFPATASSGWTSLGKRGGALIFDGVDDYTTISQPNIQTNPNVFTIAGWIYPDNQYARFITPASNGIDQWVGYDNGNQRIEFQITETADVNNRNRPSTTGSVPYNTWTHWAITLSDKEIRIYINGQLNASYTETINIGGWTDAWVIGQRGNSANYLKGRLDDLRVYSRALSATEIRALYRSGQVVGRVVGNQSMVGHWPFDEATSTRAGDFSGRLNNGIIRNMSFPAVAGDGWTRNGRVGRALAFDGVNGYVEVASNSTVKYQGGSLSVAAWIYPDTNELDDGHIFSKPWNGSGEYNYRLIYTSGRTLQFILLGATSYTLTTTTTVPRGRWSHVGATVDSAGNVKIYIDGVVAASGTHSIVSWTPVSGDHNIPLCIGTLYPYGDGWAGNSGFSFRGRIDDARMYTRVLSDAEMLTLGTMSGGQIGGSEETRVGDGLVGYWSMNGADIDTTYIYDKSGRGNNAYLSGVATSSAFGIGRVGQAFVPDGVNDFIISANNLGISGNAEFTMCSWIRWRGNWSSDFPSFMGNNSTGFTNQGLSFTVRDGRPAVDFWVNRFRASNALNTNTWYHVCGTKTPGIISATTKLYVDGVEVSGAVEGTDTTPNITASPAVIGRLDATRWFSGFIDESRFYNRALSAAEIKRLYNLGR